MVCTFRIKVREYCISTTGKNSATMLGSAATGLQLNVTDDHDVGRCQGGIMILRQQQGTESQVSIENLDGGVVAVVHLYLINSSISSNTSVPTA
jgi:hypothetical protein